MENSAVFVLQAFDCLVFKFQVSASLLCAVVSEFIPFSEPLRYCSEISGVCASQWPVRTWSVDYHFLQCSKSMWYGV